jgi:hypothetical protein
MNSSGPISLAGSTAGVSIEAELGGGGTTMISLNDTNVRTLAGVASGAITMPTNFYGKSNFQGNYFVNSFMLFPGTASNQGINTYQDASGNCYVYGQTGGSAYIAKYDSTGAYVWAQYAGSFGVFNQLSVDGSGNIYASYSNIIVKINSAGTLQWNYSFNYSGAWYSFAYRNTYSDTAGNSYISFAIQVTSSSSTYISGITKIDSTGTVVFTKQLSISGTGIYPSQLGIDASGNIWMVCTAIPTPSTYQVVIVQLSSSGALNWSYYVSNNAIGSQNPTYYPITFDSSGNAWIPLNTRVIAVSPSGSIVYNYSTNNTPQTIFASSTSNYFYVISGGSPGGTGIYKYNMTTGSFVNSIAIAGDVYQRQYANWFVNGNTLIGADVNGYGMIFFGRLPSDGTYIGAYKNSIAAWGQTGTNCQPIGFISNSGTYVTYSSVAVTLLSSGLTAGAFSYTVSRTSPGLGFTVRTPQYTAYTSLAGVSNTWGSAVYIVGGTYTWIAPTGVTSVSVLAVGSGGNGGSTRRGGGLGYKNNYSVTPGNSYTLRAAGGGEGVASYFVSTSVVSGSYDGSYTGDGGGAGGFAPGSYSAGGAGGYSGSGGNGGTGTGSGTAGSGGGAGGSGTANQYGGGGGGVSILGQGTNGSGGGGGAGAGGGGGGSGGLGGTVGFYCPGGGCPCYPNPSAYIGGQGGNFGGGSGYSQDGINGGGGGGALRIVWPGSSRTFPSTNVGSP